MVRCKRNGDRPSENGAEGGQHIYILLADPARSAGQLVISRSERILQRLVVVTSYIKVARRYEASRLIVIQSRDRPTLVTQNHSRFMIITTCDTDTRVYMKDI
jgi:hypothetical protein